MRDVERYLTALWYRPRRRPSLLQPLAWLYGAVVHARRSAYAQRWLRAESAGKPVVVIGNVTVGGTGKTPLTVWLVESLRKRGVQAGVVARGYRRSGRRASPREGPQVVRADSRWEQVGDEPLLIHRRAGCVTVVGEDRVAAARRLAEEAVDVILCDDGLQHLRLARDCEIALLDGARGLGNGRLLPAGPLREPAGRLREVDLIVVNGAPEHASLAGPMFPAGPSIDAGPATPAPRVLGMRLVAQLAHRVDGGSAPRPLETFRAARLHAVAGIGHPDRFFRDLEGRGLEVIRHAFPDHHPFAPRDLEFPDDLPILMTEKDAVRCAAFATPRMWHVPVTAQLDAADSQALLDAICLRIAAARRPPLAAGRPSEAAGRLIGAAGRPSL